VASAPQIQPLRNRDFGFQPSKRQRCYRYQSSIMPTKYRSTRGGHNGMSFEEVVLGGLATDKGLYVPESVPAVSADEIESVSPYRLVAMLHSAHDTLNLAGSSTHCDA
jgi:Threonine synthase N terminus